LLSQIHAFQIRRREVQTQIVSNIASGMAVVFEMIDQLGIEEAVGKFSDGAFDTATFAFGKDRFAFRRRTR
jgi:hypothetical protein